MGNEAGGEYSPCRNWDSLSTETSAKRQYFSASYKDPLTQQTEQLLSKISEEEVQAGQKAQLPLCLPVLSQTAGAQSYKIVWSEGLLCSFCASAAATLGRGMTSKIVFHNSVENILSLVLRQKCKILISQKTFAEEENYFLFVSALYLAGGRGTLLSMKTSGGKGLLGHGLCVPCQGSANGHDLAWLHLENEKLCVALQYFIIEKGSHPAESFVYHLAE